MTQPRFTSGAAGAFSFDVANHLLDTVDSLQRQDPPATTKAGGRNDMAIAAQLLEEVDPETIEWDGEDGQGNKIKVWKWKGLFVGKNTTEPMTRYVGGYNISQGGLHHGSFGAEPSGFAIQLGGEAARLDFVLLHPIRSVTPVSHERWFAFQGKTDTNRVTMLRILSLAPIAPQRWSYRVQPVKYVYQEGDNVPVIVDSGIEGRAYNLSEPHLYGQPLTTPDGTLEIMTPVSNVFVLGMKQASDDQGVPLYVFQAPLPLRPVCGGAGIMMMQQRDDGRFLRDGI